MRVTGEVKNATRERILLSAADLFRAHGWEDATTRAIAEAAGVGAGTVFNYFPAKETLAASLAARALSAALTEFEALRREDATLEEDLFSFIWTGFRNLEPERKWMRAALRSMLPAVAPVNGEAGREPLAQHHLDALQQILAQHRVGGSSAQLQLYWTLYCGVLAHWASDDSANQNDTLALLDQAIILFVSSLKPPAIELDS